MTATRARADVSHVDEIAAGFEVAGDEGQGVGSPEASCAANSPKAWVAGRPGPTGLNTRPTMTSSGGRSARAAIVASHLLRPYGSVGLQECDSSTGRSAAGTRPSSAAEPAIVIRTAPVQASNGIEESDRRPEVAAVQLFVGAGGVRPAVWIT